MRKGFDCATPLTAAAAAAFARDGMAFVCRYLVPSGWKALTASEVKVINAAGLDIVSVFEVSADRALGGRAAGRADGATAVGVAQKVGQPLNSCIYFAVDFDASKAQLPAIIEYIRGAAEATPSYTTGVYGSYTVVEAVLDAQACSRAWQTKAWSQGKQSARAHIYQYDCGPAGLGLPMNGITVDLDHANGEEGSWNTLHTEEDDYMMQADDANKIIGFLSAAYQAAPDEAAKEEIHRLANELRKASGQAAN
ncbi:DUF1906 domain-containing protein [Paenibacillus athensensis]|uniref:Rv2525c-like glycoside hydrolase-like domain-containing protein n=1 Tax=Paenibacillus athensensis TaxID=1967502 RepID=A0A4Y8PQW5_9BACL|nr:DUF1906 domain-containing protein [Paenibacillus athensensis]MCD1261675.1 DUF1906 domain-containing protein [Paenibacillus athensensis]